MPAARKDDADEPGQAGRADRESSARSAGEPSTTSYALLGLLAFDAETESVGLTGYELKQRADKTLRFYWVSPAMSQVYSELTKLAELGHVEVTAKPRGWRVTRHYRITAAGHRALEAWLADMRPEFPILKHSVALRLMMGHLAGDDAMRRMLETYASDLETRHSELAAVRKSLGGDESHRFAAMVADWGLAYYDAERAIVTGLAERLD
ncbi:MAG TPA: helix-turn-helix transcriptional regulator [Nocardioidaceae bacterium]|nr:helix-turn-helix transcriptional regulator [Nocardioidaceae bacterium]